MAPSSVGTLNTSPRAEKQGALAVWRQGEIHLLGDVGVADLVLYGDDAGARAHIVVADLNGNLAELFARQVQREEPAALLEGYGVAAERREVDVQIGEVRHLPGLFRVLIVDPDVGPPIGVAVG